MEAEKIACLPGLSELIRIFAISSHQLLKIPMEASFEKKKELILFEGSLKDYAEMLLKDKRGDGSVINLGEIHEAILEELSKRNIQLVDTRIIVDQHSVSKCSKLNCNTF